MGDGWNEIEREREEKGGYDLDAVMANKTHNYALVVDASISVILQAIFGDIER